MSIKGIKEILSRFHHVGVLVRDLDEAVDYYKGMGFGPFNSMGVRPFDRKLYGKPVTDTVYSALGANMGSVMVELVQPVSGESIQKDWLEGKGEGINHICFEVDDIEEAISISRKGNYVYLFQKGSFRGDLDDFYGSLGLIRFLNAQIFFKSNFFKLYCAWRVLTRKRKKRFDAVVVDSPAIYAFLKKVSMLRNAELYCRPGPGDLEKLFRRRYESRPSCWGWGKAIRGAG